MTLREAVPLAAHVIPTVAIGFGYVIPRSCIAGVNALTIGFTASIVSSCVAYWVGVRVVRAARARVQR
jgi:ABC-type Fe3+ transport system permease subunit